jgi:hypothetical protein
MRYLILSDIHANREALSAVLSFVRRKRWDKAVFLGDLVGYGPSQPDGGLARARPLVAIRATRLVCSGSRTASSSTAWRSRPRCGRQKLTASNLKWLHQLPEGRRGRLSPSPDRSTRRYIFGEIEALNVFRQTTFPVCFFGPRRPVVLASLTPSDEDHGSFVPSAEAGRALPHQPGSIGRRTGTRWRRPRSTDFESGDDPSCPSRSRRSAVLERGSRPQPTASPSAARPRSRAGGRPMFREKENLS